MGLYAQEGDAERQELFVQPRVVARTREVLRAVVEIQTTVPPTSVKVSVPPAEMTRARTGRSTITEDAFLERLAGSSTPEVVAFAKWVLDEAPKHDLTVAWGDAGPKLRYDDPGTGSSSRWASSIGAGRWPVRSACRHGVASWDSTRRSIGPTSTALIPGSDPPHVHDARRRRVRARGDQRQSREGRALAGPFGRSRPRVVREHRRNRPEDPRGPGRPRQRLKCAW